MSPDELVDNLSTLGVAHEVRRSGADGALLVLPEFGRLIGIWSHFRSENALWVNPGFLHSLRVGVKDDEWSGPGGDRVWLAPRTEFLSEAGAAVPAIDPGRYVVSSDRSTVILTNRGEAYARRSGVRVRFRITRRLRPLDEAEIDAACGQTWLRRSGCEEELDLELEGSCPVAVSLLSIAQVPPGSELSGPRPPGPLPAGPQPPGPQPPGSAGGTRRLVCLQDGDSERARLLVKACEAAGPAEGPGGNGSDAVRRGRPLELALVSPPLTPGTRRGVMRWKVFLYAFSGRSAEVKQLAARMVY